ncbi:MAG: LamG domain-containing protein [Burkholderiaceae bacterium]|nr:LamG domain-containing protein [Burkholderiaceae bacterium]
MSLPLLRRLARAGLLAAPLLSLLIASPPAAAAGPAWTLQHEFSFSHDASSPQGAQASLVGGASVVDGVLRLQGSQAFAEYAGLIPSVENGYESWWTVSLWARQTQAVVDQAAVLVGQGVSAGYLPEFSLHLSRDAQDQARIWGINQSGWGGGASAAVAPADGWHHYAVLMAENRVALYVDGQFAASGGAGFDYSTPYFHGAMRFGRQVANNGGQFNGDLDDVRIYAGALDAETIAAQYAAGPSVSAVPEPASLALMLAGAGLLAGLGARRHRRA